MTAHAIGPVSDTLLYLDGVTVSFDGFRALNNLSLVLEPGEMRAVIGPNGAGKTTMMDVITGKTRPDEGRVIFRYLDNPNGSLRDIAGVCSANGRVVGLMPHPEHAIEGLTGPSDHGLSLFYSALDAVLAA